MLHGQFSHHVVLYSVVMNVTLCEKKEQCCDVFLAVSRLSCVWELHPCSISGLWAVVCSVGVSSVSVFLFFVFFSSRL